MVHCYECGIEITEDQDKRNEGLCDYCDLELDNKEDELDEALSLFG